MKVFTFACITSGIAILCSSLASAQNVVPNGQFDSLEGWTKFGNGGQFTLDASDGSPDAPAASLVAGGSPATLIVSSCIPMSGPTTVDFQADVKRNPTVPDFPAGAGVDFYSDEACSVRVNVGGSESCFALSNGWQRCSILNLAVPDNVRSANVQASILLFSVSAKFDNIRLGPAGTVPVTLQSFDID